METKTWRENKKASDPSFMGRMRERQRELYKDPAFRARVLECEKARRRDPVQWRKLAKNAAKVRAKKQALPFNITADDLVVPEVCPVLGIPIVLGGDPFNPNGPSVDRMIPSLGYVRGNVRVISNRANVLKRDVTDPDELQKVVDYIRRCKEQLN